MELSDSKIKLFRTLSKKKAFLIFPEMEPYTFKLKLEKLKKYPPLENSLYFRKWKFLKRKFFLYFGKTKARKKFLIF